MAQWNYEALDAKGKVVSGQLRATSEKEVRRSLKSQGLRPRKIRPPSWAEFDFNEYMLEKGFMAPFGSRELGIFTKQLSVLINAGVPILQSLDILHKQERNPSLKLAIGKINEGISGGKSLAESLMSQKGFDRLYCNLVKAGEAGGVLDVILIKLSEHIERQQKIKAQIKAAMVYPTAVVVVGIGVIYGMLAFVVPKFQEMLKESNQELPAITQMVVDASEFLQNYGMFLVGSLVVFVLIAKMYVKTDSGKLLFDKATMKLPLFGQIIVKANTTSFARTLSTMLTSGVSLIDSLDIVADTIDNVIIAGDIRKVRLAVTQGKNLVEPMNKIRYFPDMVTQMIKVGEQTGQLDAMMEKVAIVTETEVNDLIGNMTKMIEPIILVVLGGSVAFILGAMYMPIFQSAGGA